MMKLTKSNFRSGLFWPVLVFLFIPFLSPCSIIPDSIAGSFRISTNFHYGFVMAHRPVLVPLQKEHVTGFDVIIALPTSGKKDWERIYIYPTCGLNYSYFTLGDLEHLGHGHALYPFILLPLNKNRNLQFNVRFGSGIGYIDKKFDRLENYKNQAIATHLNAIFAVHGSLSAKVSKRIYAQTSFGVTHFSNGSIDIPNLGINIVSISGGLSCFIGKQKVINRTPVEFTAKKWRGSVMLSGSLKKIYPPGGPRYLAGSLSIIESIRVKKKSAFGAALDIFYDNSIHARLRQDSVSYGGATDQIRFGMAGSYEIIISRLSFLMQVGGYLHTKLKTDGSIYSRFGIRYAVGKNYFACFNLKTHFAKADFFEWGGGVKF